MEEKDDDNEVSDSQLNGKKGGRMIILYVVERVFNLLITLANAIKWILLAWIGYLSIIELSGKTTKASFLLEILGEKKVNSGLYISLVVTLLLWAMVERSLRHKKVSKLSQRIAYLEKQIDPNRTSSGLLATGETNPQDK